MAPTGEPRIRRARREHGWTTINNAPAVDPALSWEAVGVLTYLLTKPDDWEVLTAHLVKFRKGGRDRMRRIMGELRAAGYMKLVRERDAGGRILDTFYEIADLPELLAHRPTENPADGDTESLESRPTADPSAGKHDPLLSTDPVPSPENELPGANDAPGELDQPTPPKRDAWLPLKEAIATVATGKPKVTGAKGQPVKWIGSLVGDVGRIAGDDVETALAIWAAFESALTPDDLEKYINAGNVGQRFTKWSLNGGAGTIRGVLARRERAASGEPREMPDWMAA